MTIFVNDGNGEREVEDIQDVQKVLVNDGSGETTVWPPDPDDQYYNLAHHLPDRALQIKDRQPDDYRVAFPTHDVTSYAGQNGNLCDGIMEASANNAIADLGTNNTYYFGDRATPSGTHFGMIGDNCTIHYDDTTFWIMEATCEVGVFKGFEFIYDESAGADGGLLGGNFSEECWAEDVTVSGTRSYGDENTNNNYTWRPLMTQQGAEGLCENVNLPDGAWYSGSGSPPGGTRSMGISTDPGGENRSHHGYIVYKDCSVSNFTGNGYYMSFNPHQDGGWHPGGALLWGCEAHNNHRGNFRLGFNDKAIGGYVQVHNMPGDLQGQGLVCDYATDTADNPTEFIGVTLWGNDFSADTIVCRNFWYTDENPVHIRFHKIAMDSYTRSQPIRFTSGNSSAQSHVDEHSQEVNVYLDDVYFYDGYEGSSPDGGSMMSLRRNARVHATDPKMASVLRDSVEVQSIAHGMEVGNTTYTSGTYDIDQLGFGDPHAANDGRPEFYFDYSIYPQYDLD